MRNIQFLSILFILLSSCTYRDTNSQFNDDFLLHTEFYPSLHAIPFRVIIQKENGESTLELDILCTKSKAKKYGIESLNPIPDSTFLINHDDWIFLRDSFYVDYKIKKIIATEDFKVFQDKLDKIDLLRYRPATRLRPSVDGISVYVEFTNSIGKNAFKSNSPTYRNETVEYLIAESILNLFSRVVEDKNTIRNIDVLTSYFEFGSKILNVNNEPFELKVLSSLPSEKEENYVYFSLIIPSNKPVVIDLSNSGILSFKAIEFLYSLKDRNNIYYLANGFSMVRLQRWGITENRIFLDRRMLRKEIKKNVP